MTASGEFQDRRAAQAVRWMHDMLQERLMSRIRDNPVIADLLRQAEDRVRRGELTPSRAVDDILSADRGAV